MLKGTHMSDESKVKISIAKKGNTAWNKGLRLGPLSSETKKKLSLIHKGKVSHYQTIETRKKLSKNNKGVLNPNFGKHRSLETRLKQSKALKGIPLTTERKKNISLAKLGKTFLSVESRAKLSASLKGKFTREKNPNWKGGIMFFPYSIDWTKTLRRSIRERDHYTCQRCSEQQSDVTFHVHHIDYNKNNCNPNNLITLCIKCHSKTFNNREYWEWYFKNKMEEN